MRFRQLLVLASAGLICLAVAACGSSKSSGSSARVNVNAGIKFAD